MLPWLQPLLPQFMTVILLMVRVLKNYVSFDFPDIADGIVTAEFPIGNSAEGDWQRRHRKRAAAVSSVRADPCYVALYYELLLVHKCMPCVPDSLDRTVPKRGWERSIQDWRIELAALYKAYGVS